MSDRIKISMVSYINSKPFLLGMELSKLIQSVELHLEVPALTAEKLKKEEVDIALVPVAVLPQLKNIEIITDYCIGSKNQVESVLLVSQVPVEKIESVYLDSHSRTSANLVKILMKEHWNKDVPYEPNMKVSPEMVKGTTACLMIGDKAIDVIGEFPFQYDLAEEWNQMTGLPFVFAVWVANEKGKTIESQLNDAFSLGIENIEHVAELYQMHFPQQDLLNYLSKSIDYNFSKENAKALDLFLHYCRNNELIIC